MLQRIGFTRPSLSWSRLAATRPSLMRVREAISHAINAGAGREISTAGIGPHLDAFVTTCTAAAARTGQAVGKA